MSIGPVQQAALQSEKKSYSELCFTYLELYNNAHQHENIKMMEITCPLIIKQMEVYQNLNMEK